MAGEQAVNARRDRNAALVEAMLLAAIADGAVSEREMQTLLRRVIERPEFEGTRSTELNALVEASAKKLAGAHNLEQVFKSLRERLPDHKNRLLAFGLAAAVALADKRATRLELGLLKNFQSAFGISEDEVAQVIDVIEQGGSIAEALGEPLERLYAEVMVLVSAADGKVKEAESRSLVESFASDPLFHSVSATRAQQYVTEAVSSLASEGLPHRLMVLARGLSTHGQRLRAFALAKKIAHSSGEPSDAEQKILDLLQATFGIADDEVVQIERTV